MKDHLKVSIIEKNFVILKAAAINAKNIIVVQKTFRRGRAIEFLDRLNVKRATLKQQLESPELQSINPILVGELKAVETIINEFIQLFEIHEEEVKGNNAIVDEEATPKDNVPTEE